MVEHESSLIAKTAELAFNLDMLFLKAQQADIPEPAKSATIHIARNAALDAGETLNQLINRWLKTL